MELARASSVPPGSVLRPAMEERLLPATQLLGAALPARLAWDRAGRRLVRQACALGALTVAAALAWGRLPAEVGALAEAPAPAPVAPAALRPLPAKVLARTVTIPSAFSAAPPLVEARDESAVAPAPLRPAPLRPEPKARRPVLVGTGEASYYARGFEGRPTASGEPYRAAAFTAAHRSLEFGTVVRVTNLRNGRSVVVRVNDRGPFHRRRILDLSRAAAAELGLVHRGRGQVRIDVIEPRGESGTAPLAVAAVAAGS